MDALTGVVQYRFAYDFGNRLVAVTDVDANVTTIEHDTVGHPTAIVGPYGQRTTLAVDTNGYLAGMTSPANETVALGSTQEGLLTSMTDPRGGVHWFTYDADGLLTRDEDPAGGYKQLSRSAMGGSYSVGVITATGTSTSYLVDNLATRNQQRSVTRPDGTTGVTVLGTNGTSTTTQPDGMRSSVTLGPDPRFGMVAPMATSSTMTTPGGRSMSSTASRTATLASAVDLLSLTSLTETSTVNGRTGTSSYTAATRRLVTTSPAGRQRTTTLDVAGRVVETSVTGIVPVQYVYDVRGRLFNLIQGARKATLSYDVHGRTGSVRDPLGRLATFEYDLANRVTRQTLPGGRVVQYAYDANGNVTSLTPPGKPEHRFQSTAVDLESRYEPPDLGEGPTATLTYYDLDRRPVLQSRPDGANVSLSWDTAGRLSSTSIPRGSYAYGYGTTTGLLSTASAPDSVTMSYAYDGSLVTSATLSGAISGSVQYGYDNNFRTTSVSVNGVSPVTLTYDADSLLTGTGTLAITRSAANGLITSSSIGSVSEARTYDGFGAPATTDAKFGATPLLRFEYDRDVLGRIVTKREVTLAATKIFAYEYDVAGRLETVRTDGVETARYAYDDNSNRLSVARPAGIETGTYDAQDRLVTYGTEAYTYRAGGELSTRTDTTTGAVTFYDYDERGNLVQVNLPSGTVIQYVTDARNRRVGKRVNGTLMNGFLWEGQLRPVAELDGSGNVVSRFVYGTGVNVPEYMIRGGTTYRLVKDHLGSPRLVVDVATGAVAQRLEYDEFGRVIVDTNPGFQPFGFAGGVYEASTGLVRFGVRDFDPVSGRWTAKDPLGFGGGASGFYSYCFSDPVNLIDMSGLRPGERFSSMDDAAIDALAWISPASQAANLEMGGWITPTGDGGFTYDEGSIVTGERTRIAASLLDSTFTPGAVAWFHTHPTSGPEGEGTSAERMSGQDKNFCIAGRHNTRPVTAYLGTPLGTVRRFNPSFLATGAESVGIYQFDGLFGGTCRLVGTMCVAQ